MFVGGDGEGGSTDVNAVGLGTAGRVRKDG